jgi:hypothetical protein
MITRRRVGFTVTSFRSHTYSLQHDAAVVHLAARTERSLWGLLLGYDTSAYPTLWMERMPARLPYPRPSLRRRWVMWARSNVA